MTKTEQITELESRIIYLEKIIGCANMCTMKNTKKCLVQMQRDKLLDKLYRCRLCNYYIDSPGILPIGKCGRRDQRPVLGCARIKECFDWNGEC